MVTAPGVTARPLGFIEWNHSWFQRWQDQTLNAILIHIWTVTWQPKKKIDIIPASFKQENNFRRTAIGCWEWVWDGISWKWVGWEREGNCEKWKMCVIIFQTYVFNPFVREGFSQKKVVNSSEQLCAKLWMLQMDLSLKWPLAFSMSHMEGCGEHTAHLMKFTACISLAFLRHKRTRSARGKPGAEA